ncbi:hypothetical protein OKW35_007540 [Paraburkholderia sp. MM5477-R1]
MTNVTTNEEHAPAIRAFRASRARERYVAWTLV